MSRPSCYLIRHVAAIRVIEQADLWDLIQLIPVALAINDLV